MKKISLDIDENALNIIDKAAKEEFSSRTSFLVRNAVKAARDIIKENN